MELKQRCSSKHVHQSARDKPKLVALLGSRNPVGKSHQTHRKQLSSFILFISVVIFVNLCPFHPELSLFDNAPESNLEELTNAISQAASGQQIVSVHSHGRFQTSTRPEVTYESSFLNRCLAFMRLMFTNPIKFNRQRSAHSTRGSLQAEARVIGKMAKVWYIKKKIKKLSKKLKKHTIAVPVFTAIPIYEHSYYPQPHVTHVSHGGLHHAAAASSYAPAVASAAGQVASQASQQMATAASSSHQQMVHPYRPMAGSASHHHHHHSGYPMPGGHQIINSYPASPPLYVDEAGGLYGQFGNAYGRYDGGYHMW